MTMGAWDIYTEVMNAVGATKRQMWVNHSRESITRRLVDSPASKEVLINGEAQIISVAHTEDMATKRICALPGEHLAHGGIVDFSNSKWLITELDPDNEVYERGMMSRCNHVLRWIGKDGVLKEKWCIVEDGTKYLIGEKRTQMITIGDARIAVTVGKDKDTIELSRGMRFLIDDSDADNVLAYEISKPNRLYNIYDGNGVFRFILTEVNLEDGDNAALRIANYSDWKPEQTTDGDHKDSEETIVQIVEAARKEAEATPDDNKEVWL